MKLGSFFGAFSSFKTHPLSFSPRPDLLADFKQEGKV